jgi:hypothetical protein
MLSRAMTFTPAQHRLIRLHLALIPVYGWLIVAWSAYAIDVSTAGRLDRSGHIKGHDFAHFYVLGQIANEHASADLYDFTAQAARMDRLVPDYENRFAPIHGPQVSLLFAPMAHLPYEAAWMLWMAITCAGYAICCAVLWRSQPSLRRYGWLAIVLAAGYPAFYLLIAFGQSSVLAVVCVTAAYVALRARRPWLAGFALGSLVYKPSLGIALPFVLLYGREWRMLTGAAVAVCLQIAAAAAYYGTGALGQYVEALAQVGRISGVLEPIPDQMQSLRSFFSVLVPWPDLALAGYLIAAAVTIVLAARCWRRAGSLDRRYAVLLLAMMLVDPHVNPYDLVALVPVFFLIAPLTQGSSGPARWLLPLLYLSYYLPGMFFVPKVTHIQLSVVALAALTVVLTRLDGDRKTVAAAVPA